MSYNPEIPRNRYDNYGDREWTRLEKDRHGELLYYVHYDILKRYIHDNDCVIEVGAGSGRYTKDLVKMCSELTVTDISSHQIEFNKGKMREFGLFDCVKQYYTLDILNMSEKIQSNQYDAVVCIGGVINYLLDKEKEAVSELLRVLKPGGKLILGSMSLIGASLFYLGGIQYEKGLFGIEATKWVFDTGIQDEEHYPVASKHYVHMMKSCELDALFSDFPVKILERSSAGLYSQAGDEALNNAKLDDEFWELLIAKEIEFTKLQGTLDCGMNIIYVVEKIK